MHKKKTIMAVTIEEISKLMDEKLNPIKKDIKNINRDIIDIKRDIVDIKKFIQLDLWEEEVFKRKSGNHTPA